MAEERLRLMARCNRVTVLTGTGVSKSICNQCPTWVQLKEILRNEIQSIQGVNEAWVQEVNDLFSLSLALDSASRGGVNGLEAFDTADGVLTAVQGRLFPNAVGYEGNVVDHSEYIINQTKKFREKMATVVNGLGSRWVLEYYGLQELAVILNRFGNPAVIESVKETFKGRPNPENAGSSFQLENPPPYRVMTPDPPPPGCPAMQNYERDNVMNLVRLCIAAADTPGVTSSSFMNLCSIASAHVDTFAMNFLDSTLRNMMPNKPRLMQGEMRSIISLIFQRLQPENHQIPEALRRFEDLPIFTVNYDNLLEQVLVESVFLTTKLEKRQVTRDVIHHFRWFTISEGRMLVLENRTCQM